MLKAILIGLVGAWGQLDSAIGSLYTFRPICTGFLVGLVLGDIQQGLIIGATLELVFLGSISMGAYIPPDALVGSVLATAFAIEGGLGIEVALALAMPIAILSMGIKNVIYMISTAICARADKYAEKGNAKAISLIHFSVTGLKMLNAFFWTFLAFYLGADVVTDTIAALPSFIVDGMSVAGGILPALGFAMLLNMVFSIKTLPFFFLGFILASYLNVPIIGVLIIAAIIIFTTIDWSSKKEVDNYDEF